MYTINLSDVIYPSNIGETVAKEVRAERARLITMKPEDGKAVSPEVAEQLIPMREFDAIDETLSTLQTAVDSYITLKYRVPDKGVIVPSIVRNQAARLMLQLTQHQNGVVTKVDPKDLEFLLNVFDADLPYINTFVFVADYLRRVKFETDAAEQAAKAAAEKFDQVEALSSADAEEEFELAEPAAAILKGKRK